jgi:hypothetical protein
MLGYVRPSSNIKGDIKMVKMIKIKKTARYYKGKKAKYSGEIIYPNGRHAVTAVIMTGGSHDTHGGLPIELDLTEVDFLFPENERAVIKLPPK